MIIPYINYEILLSKHTYFCFFTMILYLIVAMPDTNKYIGEHLHLDKYDNVTSNHRYYLWFIHSIIMAILMYILLLFYTPCSIK